MRKLLIGVIQLSGSLLSKLSRIHQHEAEQHVLLALAAADKLDDHAQALYNKAHAMKQDALQVVMDGRRAARASSKEAAQCAAIADIVKSIK